MLTRQEREEIVLDLYNQGKTIRDIAKEVRMSFRDIGAVLKKEQEKERQKKQLKNNTNTTVSVSNGNQRGLSLSAQTYQLFSQAKTPVEIAIELNLSEKQVTKYYREYWKLKGLYKLNLIYEEAKNDIVYFAKLFRLSKTAGKSAEDVVNLLKIANNDLIALEDKYKKLQQNVNHLESKELDLSMSLEELKSQIQDANQSLESCRLSYQKEVSKMLQLHRLNIGLERLLRGFRNNNKDYIKVQFVAKQTVKSALSDKRQLLKLALHTLIELWRADPTKFDSLIYGMPLASTITNSTIISYRGSRNYHTSPFSYHNNQNSHTENLMEIIVNGAASLYEKMVKDFTNETITNAAMDSSTNLLPQMTYLNEHTHTLLS
jgi:exonuclease VII small subunit